MVLIALTVFGEPASVPLYSQSTGVIGSLLLSAESLQLSCVECTSPVSVLITSGASCHVFEPTSSNCSALERYSVCVFALSSIRFSSPWGKFLVG